MATNTHRTCGCGCGVEVARRYAPGHDARHKSQLVASLTSSNWRTQEVGVRTLADLGWLGFAPLATLRAIPVRSERGMASTLVGDVPRFQVDHRGLHHANRRCSTLTRHAREVGGVNRLTRLASDGYIRLVDATPDLVADLPRGWDQCTECTHTDRDTWDEVAQSTRIAQVRSLPVDAFRTTESERVAKLPTSWEVEMDDDTGRRIRCSRNPITGVITRTQPDPISPWGAPQPESRVA